MIIFVSLRYFTVLFSVELLNGYFKKFRLEIWKGQVGKSTYLVGGCSKRTSACHGRGGVVKFSLFECVHTK